MKKLFVALLFAASAQASAFTIPDSTCLKLGEFAEVVAANKEAGITEEAQLDVIKNDNKVAANKRVRSYFTSIVSYIYTMDFKQKDTRKLVYLKCRVGDFQ